MCCRNYEHIVKAHQNNPQQGEEQVSDQVKFSVFQSIMDSLFQSFTRSVSVASFQELSACVFSWIEEHCKPQVGHSICTPYTVLLVDGWRTKSCMVLFKVMVFVIVMAVWCIFCSRMVFWTSV